MAKKIGYLAAGAAIGAASVLLSKKENRDKLKAKAKKLQKLAAKEVSELSDKAKDVSEVVEKEAKKAGEVMLKQAGAAKRKASAALKAVKKTK